MRSKHDMKAAIKSLNKKKINIIRASSMESYKDMLEEEIGIIPDKEGYILNDEINDIFIEYAEKYSGWSMELGEKFQSEYDKQNETMEYLLKKGVAGAANGLKAAGHIGVDAFKNGIFAGRH